jgi:hypothetical protein
MAPPTARMEDTLRKMREGEPRRTQKNGAHTWAGACLAVLFLLAGLFLFREGMKGLPHVDPPAPADFTHPSASFSGGAVSAAPGGSIPYAALRFPDSAGPAESGLGAAISLDIVAFDESMMRYASAVVEGVVTDTYQKEYRYDTATDKFGEGGVLHNRRMTQVVCLRVTRVVFGEGEAIAPGQEIKIETECSNGCYETADPPYALRRGRTYVLPLSCLDDSLSGVKEVVSGDITRDGEYGIVYPFAPQIEVTQDGQYVFHSLWESLWDDSTVNVETGDGSAFALKLRGDGDFLSDLRAVVQRYQVGGAG